MNKKNVNSNGFDYVDLDLPSGTLWATCNVGASKPSEPGLYFQWGDTIGYAEDQVGKDKQFNWDDYKFGNGVNTDFSKYIIFGDKLELVDDAASANMEGSWHIPSPDQIRELIENTISKQTKLDNVSGTEFTSKKDASKFIFIPTSGYAWNGSVHGRGCGYIWSSMLDVNNINYGQYLDFGLRITSLHYDLRYNGFSVRGVIDSKQDKTTMDKHNLVKTFDNEIESLYQKIKDVQEKKNACMTDNYSKMYLGKYVKIARYEDKEELSYIKECMYVRNVYTEIDSDNLVLILQGQGFRYSDGSYLDDIDGNFSELYRKIIYENQINDGTIKVDIISKDEYKKEVKKMIDFISEDLDDVEVTEE